MACTSAISKGWGSSSSLTRGRLDSPSAGSEREDNGGGPCPPLSTASAGPRSWRQISPDRCPGWPWQRWCGWVVIGRVIGLNLWPPQSIWGRSDEWGEEKRPIRLRRCRIMWITPHHDGLRNSILQTMTCCRVWSSLRRPHGRTGRAKTVGAKIRIFAKMRAPQFGGILPAVALPPDRALARSYAKAARG